MAVASARGAPRLDASVAEAEASDLNAQSFLSQFPFSDSEQGCIK